MRTKALLVWVLGGIITAFAAAIVLGAAGWFTLRSSWFEDSLSKVSVTEDADGAERIAEAMGVHLNDSAIDYGGVTSQFQGKPMAYPRREHRQCSGARQNYPTATAALCVHRSAEYGVDAPTVEARSAALTDSGEMWPAGWRLQRPGVSGGVGRSSHRLVRPAGG